MSVHHILSAKGRTVVTIEPHRTLGEAARTLAERKIGALLVTDGSRPVSGIISERDIVRAVSAQGADALHEPLSRFMTEKVVTCTTKSPVNELMEIMTDGKFRHIPVVENGALVGIISIGDVVKHRLAEIEAEAQAIKDYIATA
ncbi:CBS domain-containing protein [Microvirga rosea]|uniref:CBS domain-containing protein n=1 Tax=Microvirga rosea TaxID=2715425 RepID=UPI001D09EBE7|nr:CBS domain-containing protein [Microvirga rosea]MCB8822678.1 CBS domain-containing protein [Microvirga rosea]